MNSPRLKTPGVRQGFSYAFPYNEIKHGVYKGLMTRSGPIASAVRGNDPGVFIYETDLAKAKELILAGGFAEGDTFEYMVASEEATERAIAELFKANIAEMGFKLDVTELDSSAYNDMMYGDSPAEERPHFMGGWFWWPDYNDAWNQLYRILPRRRVAVAGPMPATSSTTVLKRFSPRLHTSPTSPSTTH